MRPMLRLAMTAVLGLTVMAPARAAIVLTATQSTGSVVISGGGTANLAGLSRISGGDFATAIEPSVSLLSMGSPPGGLASFYGKLTGPGSFGPGSFTTVSDGSGDRLGITTDNGAPVLLVPEGYVSGTTLQGSISFNSGTTFASLGMTPGTYVWTWGSGANADSLTLRFDATAAPVPEPSSLVVAGVAGIALVGYAARRRKWA